MKTPEATNLEPQKTKILETWHFAQTFHFSLANFRRELSVDARGAGQWWVIADGDEASGDEAMHRRNGSDEFTQ